MVTTLITKYSLIRISLFSNNWSTKISTQIMGIEPSNDSRPILSHNINASIETDLNNMAMWYEKGHPFSVIVLSFLKMSFMISRETPYTFTIRKPMSRKRHYILKNISKTLQMCNWIQQKVTIPSCLRKISIFWFFVNGYLNFQAYNRYA